MSSILDPRCQPPLPRGAGGLDDRAAPRVPRNLESGRASSCIDGVYFVPEVSRSNARRAQIGSTRSLIHVCALPQTGYPFSSGQASYAPERRGSLGGILGRDAAVATARRPAQTASAWGRVRRCAPRGATSAVEPDSNG